MFNEDEAFFTRRTYLTETDLITEFHFNAARAHSTSFAGPSYCKRVFCTSRKRGNSVLRFLGKPKCTPTARGEGHMG